MKKLLTIFLLLTSFSCFAQSENEVINLKSKLVGSWSDNCTNSYLLTYRLSDNSTLIETFLKMTVSYNSFEYLGSTSDGKGKIFKMSGMTSINKAGIDEKEMMKKIVIRSDNSHQILDWAVNGNYIVRDGKDKDGVSVVWKVCTTNPNESFVKKDINLTELRQLASKNIVSQALNYSSGVPEDSSGYQFFYPINVSNGQCIYGVATDGSKTPELLKMYLGTNSVADEIGNIQIDLNKGDLSRPNFYKINGNNPNYKVGNQIYSGAAFLKYQSKVEGLPNMFECNSETCSIDRLRRAWNVIAKQCKGTAKAF